MSNKAQPGDPTYVGRIHESLHGFIHLTEVEFELLDSPYLQRLRNIRQLGLANLVFPGGEHTRFSHSLGVLWVVDRICRHLKIDPQARQILRLAALLHDVGHFPLSHTLEAAYRREERGISQKKVASLVNSPRPRTSRKPRGTAQAPGLPSCDAALHERMSQFIIENTEFAGGITEILRRHHFEPNLIGPIVVGTSDVMLYNQLMHSDMDADKMDYLIRDSTSLGIGYGQFAIEYLIECFTRVKLDGLELLCVKDKGIHTVDHYLLARYFYYVQILFHRTRWIVEEAAQRLFSTVLSSPGAKGIPQFSDLTAWAKDVKRWSSFDDAWVMSVYRQAENEKWLPRECACLFDIVLRRKIPDCVYERKVNCGKGRPQDKALAESCEAEMKQAAPDTGTGLSHPKVDLHWMHEKFDVNKKPAERQREGPYKDEDELLRTDRDVIRVLDKRTDKPSLIGQEPGSFAPILEDIETHVFRAYKLKA